MSILSDVYLEELMLKGLLTPFDHKLINPASIDICVGTTTLREAGHGIWEKGEMPIDGIRVDPGEFLLVDTREYFQVPNGYAVELRLKSTTARLGWDHNAALWIDPGFQGIITMELRNCLRYNQLTLAPGLPFAQAIVHKLIGHSSKLYNGRYQGAKEVEGAKQQSFPFLVEKNSEKV